MIKQIQKLQKLRKNTFNSCCLNIIQIGANDGETNDIATHIIKPDDNVIYIEPCKNTFKLLLQNKQTYSKSIFLNLAIVPDLLIDSQINLLNQDPLNQGASFIDNLPNAYRQINTLSTQKMTILNFLNKYNINNIDIFFVMRKGWIILLL